MQYQNSPRQILTPLIYTTLLVLGITIGYLLSNRSINIHSSTSNKLDSILSIIRYNYVDTLTYEKIQEMSINSLLQNLDPHSVYITPDDVSQANEPLMGNFDGIGIQFNIQKDTVVVVNTISGGPSEKMGIRAGDRIVEVDDSLLVGKKKATSENVMRKLKGKSGSKVKLSIKRRGFAELLNFDVTRDKIPLYSVDVSYMINNSTGFVKISRFARTTHEEFLSAITKLKSQGMKKIIVDLRSNGGGYLDAATSITDEFLDGKKMMVYTQGQARKRTDYYSTSGGICVGMPTVVLIDSWTASASEIFSGALQDNDCGIIIGQRSFGKGLVQEPFDFSDGSELRLTVARYYTPTGRCIQKPYKAGSGDEYENEIGMRFLHGELEQKDSIKYRNNQKFKTPKGKIVYGGGGIMPDIFMPVDTSFYTKFYRRLATDASIYNFAFSYTDKNRTILSKMKTPNEIDNYLTSQNILQQFLSTLKTQPTQVELFTSGKIIENQIKAFIARNILDNDGFFPLLNRTDRIVLQAVEKLKEL